MNSLIWVVLGAALAVGFVIHLSRRIYLRDEISLLSQEIVGLQAQRIALDLEVIKLTAQNVSLELHRDSLLAKRSSIFLNIGEAKDIDDESEWHLEKIKRVH